MRGENASPRELLDLFDASPNPYVLVTPDLVIADANEAYLKATGSQLSDIVARYLFDAFPGSPTEAGIEAVRLVRNSILRAFQTKLPDALALVKYDMVVPMPGGGVRFEERYWSATHTPILDDRGDAKYVLQHTVDITELHRLRQQVRNRRPTGGATPQVEGEVLRRAAQVQAANVQLEADVRRFKDLFNVAPGFMALLRGPDHVFELINEAYVKLAGRGDLAGKSVREALPEIEGQGYFELLDQVYATGQPVVRRAAQLDVKQPGESGTRRAYVDFVYQPLRSADGELFGIFVQGHEVTEQVEARQQQAHLIDELRAATEKLNRTLSTGQVGIFEWDMKGDSLSISGPIARFFGVPVESAEQGLPIAAFVQGIHADDRERVTAAVQATVETGQPYEEVYRLGGVGPTRWVVARGHVETTPQGMPRFLGVLIDITEQKHAEQAGREAELRLRLALEASRMGDWSWDALSDLVSLSPRAAEIYGLESGEIGWSALQQLIHPDDRNTVIPVVARAVDEGTSYEIEYRVRRAGSPETWIASRGRGNYDGSDRLIGMLGIVEDVTTRKKAEEAEKFLLREIDHRAKNVMAVVQSLISLTPFRNRDEYVGGLIGRINALARAHSLLSNNRWMGASLTELVRQELAPHAADAARFRLQGPSVDIRAHGAQPLSMILHELATNAAKHGALSHADGSLTIRWAIDDDARLELEWLEVGPQLPERPQQAGFGSKLIAAAAQQLDAEIEQEWRPEGLRCVLRIDSRMMVPALADDMLRPTEESRATRLDMPLRVLIIEDEALIAMALESALVSAGADVIGRVDSVSGAMSALEKTEFDVAVLDLHLKGDSALPLVQRLEEAGSPFVLATGYEQHEFKHAWTLRKPISQESLVAAVQEAYRAAATKPQQG